MSKENIISRYNNEIDSINSQIQSLESRLPDVQIKLDEIIDPIGQFDRRIAELTVSVNQKIEQISQVAVAATNCGCGIVTSYIETNPASPSFGSTVTVSVGSTYFYEHAKTLRMNGEDSNYIGNNPFSPLDSGQIVSFNSGTGSSTTVVTSAVVGLGTTTYIDAVGSTFVPSINSSGISSCPTSCSSYNSQVNSLISELNTLKSQRQVIINAANVIKEESKRLYVERYSYIYSKGQLIDRKNRVNTIISIVSSNDYDEFFY